MAMNMKMLVTLDGSKESLRVVQYVAQIVGAAKELDVTLYHVVEVPSGLAEHGGSERPAREKRLDRELDQAETRWFEERKTGIEREILGPARTILENAAEGGNIRVTQEITLDTQRDFAGAILEKVRTEGFGTVVLGRRDRSRLSQFSIGGVTTKIVHHVENCAVWVVE